MTESVESAVVPFAFEDHLVRVIDVYGAPWFVAKDVAAALGIVWKRADTLANIPERWKGGRKLRTPGGEQDVFIISEPAVYKLAFRSNKPEAERFTDWVAEEVLPSIRATGGYRMDDAGLPPEAPVRTLLPGHPDFAQAVRLVREARLSRGAGAALAVWRAVGLPWVPELEEEGATAGAQPAPDDAVARFALEGIERAPGVVTPVAMLWPAFVRFCARHDLADIGEKNFFMRFARMGFSKRKVRGRVVYLNMRATALVGAGSVDA